MALWYPSINEGFGFPVLEAAYHGCPVIGSSGHAVEEIGSGYACLSDKITPEWMVKATEEASTKPNSSRISTGRALVKKFSWDNYRSSMTAIYKELGGCAGN
jgi:glycosyltransferase involved in cell wall biosynthesis